MRRNSSENVPSQTSGLLIGQSFVRTHISASPFLLEVTAENSAENLHWVLNGEKPGKNVVTPCDKVYSSNAECRK